MGRQLLHRFPTVLSRPQTSTGLGGIENKPPSSITYRIINTMRQPVFWCGASGVVSTEPGQQMMAGDEAFVVEIEHVFQRDCRVDTRELLEPLGDRAQDDLRKSIAQEITQQEERRRTHQLRRFTYSIGITAKELTDLGGVVYLQDLDMVVGFDAHRHQFHHPYSQSGQRQRLDESLPQETGVQQRILVVDNTGYYHSLFVNTGQAVLECVATRDSSLTDGVYVTYRDGLNQTTTHRYQLEEAAESLGLYRSRADAEAFGKPEARFKDHVRQAEEHLTMKKQEVLQLKQEIEETKAVQERDKREWEERINTEKRKYDHEKETHERERQNWADRMEFLKQQRSYTREQETDERKERADDRKERADAWKSLVDVGKAGLGIVSICLSLFVLLQKNAKG